MSASTSKVCVEVDDQKIQDQLCSAFEGGSNYWYFIEESINPTETRYLSDVPTAGGFLVITAMERGPYSLDLDEGLLDLDKCAMLPAVLDRKACERGLQVMAVSYPKHFADVVNEDGDATTGDVFLQCALYGEVIFG